MRNWHPFLHETLAEMKDAGHRRALGIILSSLQTEASWERYAADVAAARDKVGDGAPEVVFAPAWGDHPLFIAAMAERVDEALARVPPARRSAAALVFTAHSVPVAMASGSPYAAPARGRRPEHRGAASTIPAGPSPTRAAAARRAIRGSSPTSARRSATWRAAGRRTWWSRRSASSAITSRSCTTSTSRRARWRRMWASAFTARPPPTTTRPSSRCSSTWSGRAPGAPDVVKLVVVGGGITGLAAAHRAVELAARAGALARPHAARGGGPSGRHHRDRAPRRLSRGMRPRLVPVGKAVGARALPAARPGRPAACGPTTGSAAPSWSGAARSIHCRRAFSSSRPRAWARSSRRVSSPGRASSGWRSTSSCRAAARPTRASAHSCAGAWAARRSSGWRSRSSRASTPPTRTICRSPPPCRASRSSSGASGA